MKFYTVNTESITICVKPSYLSFFAASNDVKLRRLTPTDFVEIASKVESFDNN